MAQSKVRIAAVEAFTTVDEGYFSKNVDYAMKALDEASAGGADIICFPETFPGPRYAHDVTLDCFEAISEKAKKIQKYVVYGAVLAAPEAGKQYVAQILVGPDGKKIGTYCRTTPPGPWIYAGGSFWDFNYTTADEHPVFDTDIGKIGLRVCSEVYMPELSRILAVHGAEITFLPAGTFKRNFLKTWRTLLQARAIENLMYTVSCDNIIPDQPGPGLAIISGPEGEVVETSREGIIYMDADLDRVRWLRKAQDSITTSFEGIPFYTKPGTLEQGRRPEIFKDLLKQIP